MKDFEFNEIYIEGEGDNIRLYVKPLYKEKIYLDANLDDYGFKYYSTKQMKTIHLGFKIVPMW